VISKFKSAIFTAACIAFAIVGTQSGHAQQVEAISAPSADIALSFVAAGRISDILVKAGDQVKKGQLLARLDDGPERIQAQQFKIQSIDNSRIQAAQAELEQKKVDLQKLEQAKTKGAASDWEIEHMRLGVRIAKFALDAAIIEHEQNQRRYQHALSQLARMRLVSPIAGHVEKVLVEPGEAVKTLGTVIQLVKIDPLWIDVPVPLSRAKSMSLNQKVRVRFPGLETANVSNGNIIHISAVADAASDTLNVRIEVANPDNRPAGERVSVSFPQALAEDDQSALSIR
jgi:RND family efflux transporter MFP subunit